MGHARQLTVGAALSLSGPFSPQGWQAYRGLALWTEDVNRAGGLLAPRLGARLPLALRVEDDQGRAERVAALTERLILANQVDLLIGPYSSTLVLAAAAVAERHRRVLWNHGGSSDAISQRGFRWVVPLATPASRYFHGLLDLVERLVPAPRRVALVHGARGTFPRAAIDGAEAHARQRRFTVVARLEYPAAEADLPALIDRLAAAQPDIVLAAGRTEVDLAFARRLRAAGNVAPVVGLSRRHCHSSARRSAGTLTATSAPASGSRGSGFSPTSARPQPSSRAASRRASRLDQTTSPRRRMPPAWSRSAASSSREPRRTRRCATRPAP